MRFLGNMYSNERSCDVRLDRTEVSAAERVGRRSMSSAICDNVVEASRAREVKRSSGIINGYHQYPV